MCGVLCVLCGEALAQTQTTEHPPSSTFVRTCRDGRWRPLPANLLVEGDLIEVDADDPLPGLCKAVHTSPDTDVSAPSPAPPQPTRTAAGGPLAMSSEPPTSASASIIASHSAHVVHPSLSASPFHSFSHPQQHASPYPHAPFGHLPHNHSSHSFSHNLSPPQVRSAYPRSSPLQPPAGPGRPDEPGREGVEGRGMVTSLSNSALSALSREERAAEREEEEEERKVEAVDGHLHPMQQSHGFQSMSSIASCASIGPLSPAMPDGSLPSLASLAASSSHYYIVVEPPLKQQLTFLLRPPHLSRDDRPPPPLAVARTRLIIRRVRYLLCVCFVLYVLISIIRLSSLHGWPSSTTSDSTSAERKYWFIDLLYMSALLVLPLCLLSAPLYLFVLDALGNAYLLVVQEAVQARTEQGYGPSSMLGADGEEMRERERRERERAATGGRRRRSDSVSSASSVSTDDGDEAAQADADIDDHVTFTFIDSLTLTPASVLQHALDIASGREVWITRTVNPLLTLGGVTVFTCLDSEGILSENEPSPDHLLLFQQEKPLILDIINDPTSPNGILMEGEWRRYLPLLKPIGLNCALNHPCNLRDEQLCEYAWGGGDALEEREVNGCLCPLAREIGFDVKWIRQQYYISKVLYNVTLLQRSVQSTVKQKRRGRVGAKAIRTAATSTSSSSSCSERRIRTMSSVCIQDRLLPDSFHLLSNGDPLLTFNHCWAYWNGDTIKPIDAAIESSFQSIIQQWQHQDLHCIGFAYTPIPSMYYPLLLQGGREREYLIDTWEEGRGWEGRRQKEPAGGAEEKDDDHRSERIEARGGVGLQRGEGAWAQADVGHSSERQSGGGGAAVLDDEAEEEVLLDEATDLVEEDGRARRVRWGSRADVSSSEDKEEESADASSDCSTLDSAYIPPSLPTLSAASDLPSALNSPTAPTTILASVKPVRILSIPALSSNASQSSHTPRSQPHTPSASSSSATSTMAPPSVAEPHSPLPDSPTPQLAPPRATPLPGPPPPPSSSSASRQESGEVRISIPPSPVEGAGDDRQSPAVSPNAPLLSQPGQSPSMRRLHLQPSASFAAAAPLVPSPAHASSLPPRSSTPSHSTSQLLISPTGGAYRSSSSSLNIPPRPVSTPAVLHPHNHSTPAPASLSSNQLQPLLIPATSSPAHLDPYESRSAQVRAPAKGEQRSRASSLSHSQSSTLLGGAGVGIGPTSFLPTLSHVDSPVLPFSMSSPPVQPLRSASPPPIVNPHNTPLLRQTPTTFPPALEPPPISAPTISAPPLTSPAFLPTSSSSVLKPLQHDQLFLGMVAMRDQPKTEVRSLVEHLMAAGIRFVIFSPENERKTQAFGGKIGLFTDFNVYISLKDPQGEAAGGTQRARQGKSQLPCGVSAIREHIRQVDNVPLLVSLFTDCSPSDVKEMIRIYQENGESVMCMGSSLKVENSDSFMQADISVSLDPIPSRECKDRTYHATQGSASRLDSILGGAGGGDGGGSSGEGEEEEGYSESREFAVSSKITSMPCALPLSSTTDLMQFVALICEGRRLSTNVNQALAFALSAFMSLFLLLLLTFIIDTPPLFTGYQLLWLIVLIIPLLSFSLFFTARAPDVMKRLADKNIDIAADSGRHLLYFLLRFLPSIVIYALFFLVFLHSSYDSSTLFSTFYWQSPYAGGSLSDDPRYSRVLVAVQTYSLCIYVLALIVHSLSFVHRYESLHRLNPGKSRVWLLTCVLVFVAQVLFTMVSVLCVDSVGVSLGWYWWLWFVWPFLIVCVDELVKVHDRHKREFYHNRARSHFDTVLGMWSPK